jgi:hypothetical protein
MKIKRISSVRDWKRAMRDHLDKHAMSRYAFIRTLDAERVCSIHTGECLLADEGTVIGARRPSLESAIAIAEAAGLQLQVVEKSAPKELRR